MDDESFTSVIRNTQSDKLDWSLVDLYIEKKIKEAGCSGSAGEVVNTETLTSDFEFHLNSFRQVEVEDVEMHDNNLDEREDIEMHDNMPDERKNVMIGEVGRIIVDEVNTFEEARVNNNLDNHDDGKEAFPTIDDEEEK